MDMLHQIQTRRDALAQEREHLTSRIKAIDEEDKDLLTAARVVEKLQPGGRTPEASSPPSGDDERNPRKRDVILDVMQRLDPRGGSSAQIRRLAKEWFSEDINSNTFTVTAVRLRKEQRVRLEGSRTWFLAKGQEAEEPSGEAHPEPHAEPDGDQAA